MTTVYKTIWSVYEVYTDGSEIRASNYYWFDREKAEDQLRSMKECKYDSGHFVIRSATLVVDEE